jgi:RHS repeat-associated protein
MSTTAQLSENSHQGFDGIKAALCLASMEANSNTASGMPVCLRQNGIGSRSSSKERDTETGLDYFGARHYSGAQGRFMTTDPIIISSNRLSDPQLLNAYAYVRNNPLRFVDLNGEDLFLSGSVDDAKAMLCQMLGDACFNGGSNLVYDAKSNILTVDLTKVDLNENEGANLINDLVSRKGKYNFTVGSQYEGADGNLHTFNRKTENLPAFPNMIMHDPRTPPGRFNDLVAINPAVRLGVNRESCPNCGNMSVTPDWGLAFHELAEAYGKIDVGFKTYAEGHQYAVGREDRLRKQRSGLNAYLPFSGEKQVEMRK